MSLYIHMHIHIWGFTTCSAVKNPAAMQKPQETQVWSLCQENPQEEGMATHSSVLAWRIPGTGEPGELPSMGSRGVRHDWSDLAAAAQYIMTTSVVTYRCESWTIKKAECQRINTFELWCCRRLLGVPWTARRSNQSIAKEINPEYSLERLMLKLNLQYFGHLMQRVDSLEKEPDPEKDWRQKEERVAENEMVR